VYGGTTPLLTDVNKHLFATKPEYFDSLFDNTDTKILSSDGNTTTYSYKQDAVIGPLYNQAVSDFKKIVEYVHKKDLSIDEHTIKSFLSGSENAKVKRILDGAKAPRNSLASKAGDVVSQYNASALAAIKAVLDHNSTNIGAVVAQRKSNAKSQQHPWTDYDNKNGGKRRTKRRKTKRGFFW